MLASQTWLCARKQVQTGTVSVTCFGSMAKNIRSSGRSGRRSGRIRCPGRLEPTVTSSIDPVQSPASEKKEALGLTLLDRQVVELMPVMPVCGSSTW
jgi:hypothetical protein